ncbi:hypothetical protein WH8501_12825 [Crocosphaera watsonii WH 8501]|uniref:Uncharacterized protein n=5 Tax=Crocosphaera watsonii TaxID=263511 RepID=Q4BYJ3_CROWT|nr:MULTISPECIES: hypothetical protein [Crocosphaera]EAM48978.1 hypothetical protein CwatDRAFT_1705 [Crocosphaera watsonii WH 8501]EHJ10796.1 hypothetical protein CWATWH0003_4457 [Crocosphaera watsonii WH 0003]MCH2246620.1 hypothetical protein [Crocosphaera sp.]NQZ62750.1 hypothetical protein [Crocosphaera sp.]CCQ59110.1 hypothetical protein CWATWH0005_4251 [Crocosphaera watsonii WH 0005]
MSHHNPSQPFPAPCIIDFGIIINAEDMKRILNDLGRVRYIHTLDGQIESEGEGWIVEVFNDPAQATIVVNRSLYLNVQSFDYLQLQRSEKQEAYFDLIQDRRRLRLIPVTYSSPIPESNSDMDPATLEAMVTQVLAAKWDMQLDDEDDCPF